CAVGYRSEVPRASSSEHLWYLLASGTSSASHTDICVETGKSSEKEDQVAPRHPDGRRDPDPRPPAVSASAAGMGPGGRDDPRCRGDSEGGRRTRSHPADARGAGAGELVEGLTAAEWS